LPKTIEIRPVIEKLYPNNYRISCFH